MRVTLLGTGDATAVPAPLCGCKYCTQTTRRRHPGVLVESETATILFDIGPDIQEQLHKTNTRSVDAAFLTHAHGDHSAGLPTLYQAAKWNANHLDETDELKPTPEGFNPDYPIYLTETARSHLKDIYGFLGSRLDLRTIVTDERVHVEDMTVDPFPVKHHRPAYDTLGFSVSSDGSTVSYAPDMRRFVNGPPDQAIDLLVCEGAAVLGQPVHGPRDELIAAIESVGAGRTVLVNVNEHLQRAHTSELEAIAAEAGYELGRDFETLEIS